jgi:excisionase family DNA binding protein
MYSEKSKPLYALTIGEYIDLTREAILSAINENPFPEKHHEPDDEHFTISELAKFLGCSLVSVHNYKKKGLPFYRMGRKILFKKSEVLLFMQSASKGRRRI